MSLDDRLHIAVFADVHGHLRLMLQLCRLWQRAHQRHLDGVLICGDLGFFPDPSRIDSATRRFAEKDPEELGFANFFARPEPLETDPLLESMLLGPPESLETIRARILWTHGNHEDFRLLEQEIGSARVSPVDAFDRFEYVRTGETVELGPLRLGFLGGAPELMTRGGAEAAYEHWRLVDEKACARIVGSPFHVLISHGAPTGLGELSDREGSPLLRSVVELSQPAFQCYGHHRGPIAPARLRETDCYYLESCGFEPAQFGFGPLRPRCMGLLRWQGPDSYSFDFVDDAWTRQVRFKTWMHL